jgi:hypothetical protein
MNINNRGIYNNKRFWIGCVSLLDGRIEEVYTYEQAKVVDFHHTRYFSVTACEKFNNYESAIFWINDFSEIEGKWRCFVPSNILDDIRNQIEIKEIKKVDD